MKKHRQTALFALALLLFSTVAVLRASETGPEEVIAGIRTKILDPNFNPDGFPKDLIEVLKVTLKILPEKDYNTDFKNRITWVIGAFNDNRLFFDKVRPYLGLSFKLVADGAVWQIPEELKNTTGDAAGIRTAIKLCARYLETALAEMKAGRNEAAVRELLGFGMTGLIALLLGFIQTLFGFVDAKIEKIAAAGAFILSASLYALLGLILAASPLEDREIMDGRRERPGRLSRMVWKVFPLVTFLFLILTWRLVITPFKRQG